MGEGNSMSASLGSTSKPFFIIYTLPLSDGCDVVVWWLWSLVESPGRIPVAGLLTISSVEDTMDNVDITRGVEEIPDVGNSEIVVCISDVEDGCDDDEALMEDVWRGDDADDDDDVDDVVDDDGNEDDDDVMTLDDVDNVISEVSELVGGKVTLDVGVDVSEIRSYSEI